MSGHTKTGQAPAAPPVVSPPVPPPIVGSCGDAPPVVNALSVGAARPLAAPMADEFSPSDDPLAKLPPNVDQLWLEHAQRENRFHFTLRDMFLVTAAAALLLTLTQLVSAAVAAAAVGLVVMFSIGLFVGDVPRPRVFYLAWWVLLCLYLLLALKAALVA